jgi:hypothetical protein
LDKKRHDFPPDAERKEGMKLKNSPLHEAKYIETKKN